MARLIFLGYFLSVLYIDVSIVFVYNKYMFYALVFYIKLYYTTLICYSCKRSIYNEYYN